MDACIARGGISHVLSQARASLKNPSRPFTPRSTERPLFHGDDYRPGSRPSSSYSVAEQNAPSANPSKKSVPGPQKASSGPLGAALPPRPVPKVATTLSAVVPSPPTKEQGQGQGRSASEAHLKLLHAPPRHHEDETSVDTSDGELSGDERDSSVTHHQALPHEEDPLESSLGIPSSDTIGQSLRAIEKQIDELAHQLVHTINAKALDTLTTSLTMFVSSTAVYVSRGGTASKHASAPAESSSEFANVFSQRRRLFHALVDLAVGPWHTAAKCVISITPTIFDLFEGAFNDGDADGGTDASAKVTALGKVLFVLSKESGNDAEFCNVRYVESALLLIAATNTMRTSRSKQSTGKIAMLSPMKTLIYVAGTLKNISSGDNKMLKLLATNGAIATLGHTLLWRSNDPTESKEIAQFLVQTTTILRNLSTSKSYLKQFNEAEVAPRLCDMVAAFIQHQELMANVSRILGKLTLHEVPRAQINQNVESHVGNLLKLVDPRCNPTLSLAATSLSSDACSSPNQGEAKLQDVLLVRILFVLGNLCASNDRNRHFVGVDAAAVPILLQSLDYFGNQYVRCRQDKPHAGEDDGKLRECVDVLVKLVRLLANVSMNADVGAIINSHSDDMAILLQVFDCAKAEGTCDDELMLNIVSCITNLSYYSTSGATVTVSPRATFIEANRLEIAAQLSQILWDANEEAALEAARAFGNLSRFNDVLRAMGDHKVLDGLVILLDHSNREIVYTVCGVLMNAALDENARAMLLDVRHSGDTAIDARTLLTGIVECAALDDTEMSCIAAKVLYNLLLTRRDDDATKRYLASADGEALQRIVTWLLKKLQHDQDLDANDDASDQSITRRDLHDVLTQLKKHMARCAS